MDRKTATEKAQALVAQMTLEEKASQLRYDAPAIPRLGIPSYNWWNEALHGVARAGVATSFPQAIGMAAMFDDDFLQTVGDAVSTEGRAKYNDAVAHGDRNIYRGLTFWSPNINIFRDPRWGRGHETYGEDPYLTAQLGKAYVRGLQGSGETLKSAACAKHFAVHSGPENLRHSFDAVVTPRELEETYLPAFEACIREADVESVMGAYNRTNGEPCCGSKYLLVEKLRREWGFRGHVVSDCWAIKDFHDGHFVTEGPEQSVKLALEMGCDLNCGCTYQHIVSAAGKGLVPEEHVTRSCVRLFTTRYMLGIMGEGSEYDSISIDQVESPEHLELAQEAARRSCVLLKNNGLLPLDPDKLGTVGVIGPNANSRRALIGNYHGTSSRYITALEGIQDALEGKCRVLYAEGSHLFKDTVEGTPDDCISEALSVAERSDAVVLVLGLDESLEGEEGGDGNIYSSGDKRDLLLPPSQRRLMDAVLAVQKPTVILLMAGSAIDLTASQEKADAILLSWYPGARGGKAVADLLFGKASPSGKLPVTFYYNEALEQMPSFEDYALTNKTYRYYTGTPIYPFGFGLTYGDVCVTALSADKEEAAVTAVNRGSIATQEVLQLYIKDTCSAHVPVNPILCGFKRIFLAPGEEKTFRIPIDPKAFTAVSEEGKRIPGTGPWKLYANVGQPDQRTEVLTGKKALSVTL